MAGLRVKSWLDEELNYTQAALVGVGRCAGLMEVRGKAISIITDDGRNARAARFFALALHFCLSRAVGLWVSARKPPLPVL